MHQSHSQNTYKKSYNIQIRVKHICIYRHYGNQYLLISTLEFP